MKLFRPVGMVAGLVMVLSAATAARGQESGAKPAEQPAEPAKGMGMVKVAFEIQIDGKDEGKIVLELDGGKAPETVANFVKYVDDGFYNGTVFHRIKADFMIQGGGFTDLKSEKKVGLRPPIKNEAKNGLKNDRGTIAMARTGDPHSATAQFFINVVDNGFLNNPGRDGWGYCVFGKVVEGLDVVEKIKAIPTKPSAMMRGENSEPTKIATITKAYRADGAPAEKKPG